MKAPLALRLPYSPDYFDWFASKSFRAFMALGLGLIAISFAPIFIRLCETEITPYATIFHRSWMAMLMFAGLEIISRNTSNQNLPDQKDEAANVDGKTNWKLSGILLLLLGVTFTVAVVSWAWALTQTTVANSSLLHSLTPLFTGLFAWMFWGQKFSRAFLLGVAIATGGAILLGVQEFSFNPEHLWGDAVSLFSAVFFSVEPLLAERLRERFGSSTIMFWCFAVVTVLTLPLVLLFPDGSVPVSLKGWLTILAMAVVCQVIGHGLLTYCLKYIAAEIVSLSYLLVPVMSSVEAWLFFNESLTWLSAIIFTVVLGGIVISVSGLTPRVTADSVATPTS
ncbi:MAG: DMT family transporter [Nostocaceae cyanobacterium]|nr:DMT family transporter [Nostocaceae cyanobacterium]